MEVALRMLIVVAAVQACRPNTTEVPAATQRHALPGFSIALPEGTVLEDKSTTYVAGNYTVGVKGSWVVMVVWGSGPLSKSLRHTYQESWKLELDHPLPMHVPQVPSETFIGTNHAPARVTFVTCGQRHLVIASIHHENVDKLHAEVLATFTCSPDKSKEHPAGARIDLADRAGWQRVGDDPNAVMLARDGGAQTLIALFYETEPSEARLDAVVSKYKGTLGEGNPRPLTSPLVRGWVRVLHCGDEHWVAALYVEAGSGAAERGVVDGVRCQRDDEAEIAWPAAPAELQQLADQVAH